jgi:mannitol/fructose-specific phosphotransferase system IIA component (Ntr-type)
MALIDRISPGVIKVPLAESTKEGVIRELVQLLVGAGKVKDLAKSYEAVLSREALASTGLENGIAVPHAKTQSVADLCVAIGISPKGVDFGALDGKPSYLFFLLLAPPDKSGPHIEALAEIARMTRSPSFTRALRGSTTAEQVMGLFKE